MTVNRVSRIAVGLGFIISGLFALPAQSTERLQSQTMSCQAIKSAIVQKGSVVLRYPSKRNASNILFDRYVASSRQCARGEIAEWKSAPVKGGKSCRLLVCNHYDPSNYPFGVPFRTLWLR